MCKYRSYSAKRPLTLTGLRAATKGNQDLKDQKILHCQFPSKTSGLKAQFMPLLMLSGNENLKYS